MLDDDRFRSLIDARARHPERIAELAAERRRRPLLGEDGTLFLIAADHAARGVLKAGDRPLAMADRRVLLERVLTALEQPGVDGLLGSPDLIDDLLLLDALHDRIVIGTMNRGGLAGAAWELDDRFTAYDAESIEALGLDGGKMLIRFDYADPGTLATLEASAAAVSALARRRLVALVEVLPAARDQDGALRISKDPDLLIRAMGVGAALGVSSAWTWLKIPVVDDMERVMAATTLPTLLLGGDPGDRAAEVFAGWRRALAIPQVRGLVAGRALLFPPDGDVVRTVSEASGIVHGR
ncbi:MAG: Cgl0159 family (beta/alpha)8-fold protein [Gemmatimonadota bacterium]